MKLWYGHFIGNFKSPTCPDVPGGKEKIFATTLLLCRGIVAFDLIWPECFLLSVTVEPTVCMGLKKCFSIIYQACSQAPADQNFFFIFYPTLGRKSWFLAEGQNHCRRPCGPAATFKHFFFGRRPKMIMDTHSIRFLEGCSAPIGCNLNFGTFHENPALGLI